MNQAETKAGMMDGKTKLVRTARGPIRWAVVLAGAAIATGCGQDSFPQREKSADILALETVFDLQLDLPAYNSGSQPYRDLLLEQFQSGMAYTYYNIQGPLDGIISMFEASGRRDHFELVLELCENMVAAANQDRDGDGHPEWDGSRDGVPPSDGRPDHLLPDFQGAVAIVRLARVILTDPGLAAAYGQRGAELASFVSDHIVDKWLYTQNTLNWFRSLPGWSDKASMLVRMLADLYAINWDSARRELAVELANQFITTTLVHDAGADTYTWPAIATWDTSHTNREAVFIDVCAQTGIVFTDLHVQRVANTLTQLIWNGSLSDPRCANYHTGKNDGFGGRGPWAWGRIYDGWIRTGRLSPDAQALGQAILDLTQTDHNINPTVTSSSHNAGVLAMSGHLARNLGLDGQ